MDEKDIMDSNRIIESKTLSIYTSLIKGQAICFFTGLAISFDNLYAVFSINESEYKFCSTDEEAIAAYSDMRACVSLVKM